MPEIKRKTLANCDLPDFMRQAFQTSKKITEFYKKVNVSDFRKQITKKYGLENPEMSEEERENLSKKAGKDFIETIFETLMTNYAEEFVEIIGMAAFMDYEQAKKLSFSDAFDILEECMKSDEVMSFFISAAKSGGKDTAGILVMLMLLRHCFLETDTSEENSYTVKRTD